MATSRYLPVTAKEKYRKKETKRKAEEEEEEGKRARRDFWPHRHGDIVPV